MHSPYSKIPALDSGVTSIRMGGAAYFAAKGEVSGEHVFIEGEPYVCIRNVDGLKPFFMSVVSNGDFWIFAGSNSPFSAGRSHPDNALFPYQTVDKILQHPDSAGAVTLLLVQRGEDSWALWEPWRASGNLYRLTRNLYKHTTGSVVMFEEINHDLGLRLRWSLTASEKFGLVRQCELKNLSSDSVAVKYLDGWHRLLPAGVTQDMYARISYLAAAYMRHERDDDSLLGIYTLNSRITDRAQPAESLRASCAWSLGHKHPTVLLSSRQMDAFRRNDVLVPETEVRGDFGAYLVYDRVELGHLESHRWTTVAETGLDHGALVTLKKKLRFPDDLAVELAQSVAENIRGLRDRIAAADGLQQTADSSACVHHFANVLFNCMRGGTFVDSYSFPSVDFARFLQSRNLRIFARHQTWLQTLPEKLTLEELSSLTRNRGDGQLNRLAGEYLPITFSRRHGDPSRPWNRFAIRVKDEQDQIIYDYQGNWRDIFQNWESLASSYPVAIARMIAVFLNASTADGYNPYRVTRGGIEWEVLDHEDPWSHIGYWGDHQLIYLLRLLQASENHYPGQLSAGLGEARYAYARVPYEIGGFDRIALDPGDSILFNQVLHQSLVERAKETGNDGKLVTDESGEVVMISLAEKLLVPLLAKLSNFVPEGGIWMNTQRPDWNDANNALVGWGLSMVTVYQMRPYVLFLNDLFAQAAERSYEMSTSVAELASAITSVLERIVQEPAADRASRYVILEALGRAGEKHRESVYRNAPRFVVPLETTVIRRLLDLALVVIDTTIRANRRADGMYHNYNLLQLEIGKASLKPLQLMLEGQVAVLGSQVLEPEETLLVLQALRRSDLYRLDQHSYMLYPDRKIRSFLSRNTLPKNWQGRAPMLSALWAEGRRDIVIMDEDGDAHFQADITNESDLFARLDVLAADPAWRESVGRDRQAIAQLWEEVFEHGTFLGRSGTMFAFEGLGSIYWHMVAKLLLAVQENYHRALEGGAKTEIIRKLGEFYHDIRQGLGFTKTPQVYGAMPSDPYSHTPSHQGAQQPGMTGQVKEEILTRWGELGVEVRDGSVRFQPSLLRAQEFFLDQRVFTYVGLDGEEATWELPGQSLGFTYCQIPICYQLSDNASITLERLGETIQVQGSCLSKEVSSEIFSRTGTISRVLVRVPAHRLFF